MASIESAVSDIIKELDKPGRDPRRSFEAFAFDENVCEMKDLVTGMQLPGIVTNVTKFGAFVDIGVHQDGFVHISLRGAPSPEISEPADYVIQYGGATVDVPTVVSLISRMGIRFKHLEGRLIKSFESFADHGFSAVDLKLPGESTEAMEDLRVSLKIIARFDQAVEKKSPIEFTRDNTPQSLLPILNELNEPDPNLTMVAAVNALDPSTMTAIVQKLTAKTDPAASGFSVFHRLFKIKHLQRRLKKPPLRIENAQVGPAAGNGLIFRSFRGEYLIGARFDACNSTAGD